jgi:hypothetical protein
MDKARVYVDFNELIEDDVVMLSQKDTKIDSGGNLITFYEGMPISVYMDDEDIKGEVDNLIADGVVIKHNLSEIPQWAHVKWFCKINKNGIIHESDLR